MSGLVYLVGCLVSIVTIFIYFNYELKSFQNKYDMDKADNFDEMLHRAVTDLIFRCKFIVLIYFTIGVSIFFIDLILVDLTSSGIYATTLLTVLGGTYLGIEKIINLFGVIEKEYTLLNS